MREPKPWVWVALTITYLFIAWSAATTLIGTFWVGFTFSLSGLIFWPAVVLALVLSLIGIHDIRSKLSNLRPRQEVNEKKQTIT